MSKKISGSEYPLAKIFSSEFEYIIPSYQRPYAWTVEQAAELFDDLYDFYQTEQDEGYFLGSIVLIKKEGVPYAEVIDGQQRLTTLTILISGIASNAQGDDRVTLSKYIIEPGNHFEGLKAKPRLTLRERDNDFFAKHVLGLRFDELLALGSKSIVNEAQENIQQNSKLLLNRIDARFGDAPDKLQQFVAFLLQRCFLVAVSTPSQQSAFRVFSVMNNRGLDLQPTDIIKADIIGMIREADQSQFNERWESLEVELGRNGFNDLFAYVRMIYAKEKAKRALLEEFRKHVLPKMKTPQSLIVDILEPYGEALNTLRNANYSSANDAQTINSYLRWLGRIDNSDWIPASMMFLAQKQDDATYVQWFFERMERLAAFMHICGKNVNERIERYSQIISQLELSSQISNVELTNEEKEEFFKQLDEDIYQLTARRRNYLILRLDSFISDGAAFYDTNLLTIEHVLPQTISDGSEWSNVWADKDMHKLWVHRLANLVPLNKRRNSAALNYDFAQKKKAYFAGKNNVSSYALTTQVLQEDNWSPDVVETRQKKLLAILVDKWKLNKA